MRTPRATRIPTLAALALAVPALVLAGCEAPETEPPPAEEETEMETGEMPGEDPAEPLPEETVQLEEVGGSGVSGEAVAMHSEDTVVIVVDLEGLPAEGEYQAHIHSGTCAEGGGVAEPLNPVMGLEDGTGSSTTMFEPDQIPTDEPHFVQVHGDDGSPIACGDMEQEM